jgi:streptomycin 6-kinase
MAKNQSSNEKVTSIAEKVMDGKKATPEETRSLAAAALGRDGEDDETSALAAKVMAGNHEATQEEMKSLAASVLGRD